MANFWTDNPDLQFQFSQIDWARLAELTQRFFCGAEQTTNPAEAAQGYRDLLEAMGEYIAEQIAPHQKELDAQHPAICDGECEDPPRMKTIMAGLAEMGAFAVSMPERHGGMNAPILVGSLMMEMLARADVSVMSHFGFHTGIAQALALYSIEEGSTEIIDGKLVKSRFDEQINKMASGEEWGAMVLTEAGAGSDLAQIRAKAVEQADGSWRLSGEKIFITSGHGEHHIVIARTEDASSASGLKGLSLFYVPAHVEKDGQRVRNCEIAGVEHKMGQHSAVAATIRYDDSYAELLGKRGHGFLGMLLLMNNARIAVGFESIGIMECAFRLASSYAQERVTMGKPIARHEMIADYLDEMDITIRGLRAITFEAAFHEEVASRMKGLMKIDPPRTDEERARRAKEIRRHKRKARALTPLIKYIGGEASVHHARMAMQILGGIGYITETGAEKLLRDALVIPVYEGTSQIQALMALKDTIQSVLRNPRRFLAELTAAKFDVVRGEPLARGAARLRSHALGAVQTILTNIAADKLGDLRGVPVLEWKRTFLGNWDPSRDFSFGLLHAERLTKLLAWATIAERLVAQAESIDDDALRAEREAIAERFIERFEPRARGVLAEIEAKGGLLKRLRSRGDGARSDGSGGAA